MNRLRRYFAQYSKEDLEILVYFIAIVAMVILIPAWYLWDYVQTYEFQMHLLRWKFFLTRSLQNLHGFGIDILLLAWYTSYIKKLR